MTFAAAFSSVGPHVPVRRTGNGQLLLAGQPFSAAELQSMRLDGLLRNVHGWAYVPYEHEITPETRGLALAAAIPENLRGKATAGRLSAAWIYGCAPAPARISLLVDSGHRASVLRPFSGCTVHEVSLGRFDATTIGGMPVTSPLRTAVDIALHVMPEQALPALRAITTSAPLSCPLGLVRQAIEATKRVPNRKDALAKIGTLLAER